MKRLVKKVLQRYLASRYTWVYPESSIFVDGLQAVLKDKRTGAIIEHIPFSSTNPRDDLLKFAQLREACIKKHLPRWFLFLYERVK